MPESQTTKQCEVCGGSGKRSIPAKDTDTPDKFAAMCPYCSGTGQALKLDAATLAALSLGATKQ